MRFFRALLVPVLIGLTLTSAPLQAAELLDPLPEVLAASASDEMIPVVIVMEEQLERSEILGIAQQFADRDQRRAVISARLKEAAGLGQQGLLAVLATQSKSAAVANIRPLWISSVVGADVSRSVILMLAGRSDIRSIAYSPKRNVFLKDALPGTPLGSSPAAGFSGAPELECGVEMTGAADVWSDIGLTGAGVVVAIIDSGVCSDHTDIRKQIWVNPGEDLDEDGEVLDSDDLNGVDDDGNGYVDDLIGWNLDQSDPFTPDGLHGSHTAGTVAGDGTSGIQSGMAPDARIMDISWSMDSADEIMAWEAMQYAADNGADVISISWGWKREWEPDRATWRATCDNIIDMGTTLVVAGGNEGDGEEPYNLRTPGDVPRVISVGATSCSDELAGFSSIGPVAWDDVPPYSDHAYPPGLIKPDVAAPGVNTWSHNLCSEYDDHSGTSQAAPHVAGAVALMLSANPKLEPDEIKAILRDTAVDLGDPGLDNQFGAGRIDAYAAVGAVVSGMRYVSNAIDDSDPFYANGNGVWDTGEVVSIRVTLRNEGASSISGVLASLTSESTGVEILDAVAYYPEMLAGSSAESAAPHFRVRVSAGCGREATFRLRFHHDDGPGGFAGFTVSTGLTQEVVRFEDDMETDKGWTVTGTAHAGSFVRADPHEVVWNETIIQPEDDNTELGTSCWVTGNPPTGGAFNPESGDVDKETILTSPRIDAAAAKDLLIDFARWFYWDPEEPGGTPRYVFSISNDDGENWSRLDYKAHGGPGAQPYVPWSHRTAPSPVEPSSTMRLRLELDEVPGVFPTPDDSIIEMAFDDVRVYYDQHLCEPFHAPAAQAPNPVGDVLLLSREAGGTRFDWEEPPSDPGHDPASFYDLYRSESAATGFVVFQTTTINRHTDFVADPAPDTVFHYVVASRNEGGSSGEEPTP